MNPRVESSQPANRRKKRTSNNEQNVVFFSNVFKYKLMCKPDRVNGLDKVSYDMFQQNPPPIACIECQLRPSISVPIHPPSFANLSVFSTQTSRSHGLHLEHGVQEVLNHGVPVLLARLLDHLNLLLGFLVRLLLGGLVALAVLHRCVSCLVGVERSCVGFFLSYLGLELLELVLLVGFVVGDFLLGLVTSLLDALGADCGRSRKSSVSGIARIGRIFGSVVGAGLLTFSSCAHTRSLVRQFLCCGKSKQAVSQHTPLYNLGCLPLSLPRKHKSAPRKPPSR